VLKAEQFLLSHQKKDGSWDVRSTKRKKRGSIEETTNYWGTTRAILGLIKGLEKMKTPAPQN